MREVDRAIAHLGRGRFLDGDPRERKVIVLTLMVDDTPMIQYEVEFEH